MSETLDLMHLSSRTAAWCKEARRTTRAISTWVHNAPPWFYVLHLPGILFPWFFLAVAALRGVNRLYLGWIAAVLIPYSLMSSKLDIYMMAMIPPVALMIADRTSIVASRLTLGCVAYQ